MAITITCSGCEKKLRMSKRPEAGKKVKCPSCGEAFLPEVEDEAEPTAIQAKPRAGASARRRDQEEEAPVRKHVRDEEDEADDEPRARKKPRKQKSGSRAIVFALLGTGVALVALSCCGVGVTGFVWPGFFLRKPDEDKLLSKYLIPGADLVMGVHAKGLRDTGNFDMVINGLNKAQPQALPQDLHELFRECDRAVMSMNISSVMNQLGPNMFPPGGGFPGAPPGPGGLPPGPGVAPPKMIAAVLMSNEAAVEKAKNAIRARGAGAEERLGRYPVLRQREANGQTMVYCFPTARTIVITSTPTTDEELTGVVDKALRDEPIGGQVAKMAALVDKNTVWMAYSADEKARGFLKMLPMFMGMAQGVPPPVQAMTQSLGKLRGAGLGVQALAGGGAQVQLHVDCDDPAAAKSIKDGGDALRQQAIMHMANDQAVPPSVRQDINSLTFNATGTVASGSITLSAQTLQTMNAQIPPGIGRGKLPGR
jgi:hypothetical protein